MVFYIVMSDFEKVIDMRTSAQPGNGGEFSKQDEDIPASSARDDLDAASADIIDISGDLINHGNPLLRSPNIEQNRRDAASIAMGPDRHRGPEMPFDQDSIEELEVSASPLLSSSGQITEEQLVTVLEVWDILENVLTPRQRNVLVSFYKNEQSLEQIAEDHNMTVHQVIGALSIARAKFRKEARERHLPEK